MAKNGAGEDCKTEQSHSSSSFPLSLLLYLPESVYALCDAAAAACDAQAQADAKGEGGSEIGIKLGWGKTGSRLEGRPLPPPPPRFSSFLVGGVKKWVLGKARNKDQKEIWTRAAATWVHNNPGKQDIYRMYHPVFISLLGVRSEYIFHHPC